MMSEVFLFGIRHHGPGSAFSLRQELQSLQPDAILVEGPPEANSLVDWVVDPAMEPPVALLLYVIDQPRLAAMYPFATFSPEWQALQYGITHGLPTRFCDLPLVNLLALRAEKPAIAGSLPQTPLPSDENQIEEPAPPLEQENPVNQDILSFRDPLAWIAAAAGYGDSERWWEHLVEERSQPGQVFQAVRELMTALRSEVDKERAVKGATAFPRLPFELQREAAMRRAIRQAQSDGYRRIAVVCGAWHLPALAEIDDTAGDDALLKDLPQVEIGAAWVPWSNGRLAWESGYGAGIESPGYYETLWFSKLKGSSASEITIQWLTQSAHCLRQEDLEASSASIIEAVRLAENLAALRGRPVPGLSEFTEASQAVFCFGDPTPLNLIRQKLIVGDRLGQVPPGVPISPLQADITAQQKRLRLPPEASQRDLDLDLRLPNSRERSYLLHRLAILQIPWGEPIQVSGKSGTFHEIWRMQWKPEFAVDIVSASLWGNTVADASEAFVCHLAENSPDLASLTALINDSLLADLPEAVQSLMRLLQERAATTGDTGQLMQALPALAQALRYGNVRQTNTGMIQRVVDGLVARICVGLPSGCASLNDDAASRMYSNLLEVHRAIQLLQDPEHLETWLRTLRRLADQEGLHGMLAGRVVRLLFDQGAIAAVETARRLGLGLSTSVSPNQSAAWIEGFFKDSGSILVHDEQLWGVVDRWVAGLGQGVFNQVLPLLRRTFSSFTAPERRQLGERARSSSSLPYNLSEEANVLDLRRAAEVLLVLAKVLGVPLEILPKEEHD